MTVDHALTEAIPTPVVRRLPPIEEPTTSRVYPVHAPTLTLVRNGEGWESGDGLFRYPTTRHMLADWPEGVAQIPDPSPFEAATAYFRDRPLPFELSELTPGEWDAARTIVSEVLKVEVIKDVQPATGP